MSRKLIKGEKAKVLNIFGGLFYGLITAYGYYSLIGASSLIGKIILGAFSTFLGAVVFAQFATTSEDDDGSENQEWFEAEVEWK